MSPATWNELQRFVTWMYEEGPDPNAVPRQTLLTAYAAWLRSVDTQEGDD
jgi:hypothetical protein